MYINSVKLLIILVELFHAFRNRRLGFLSYCVGLYALLLECCKGLSDSA